MDENATQKLRETLAYILEMNEENESQYLSMKGLDSERNSRAAALPFRNPSFQNTLTNFNLAKIPANITSPGSIRTAPDGFNFKSSFAGDNRQYGEDFP